MTTNRLSRRKKKKRANTLDPTTESFRDSARFALSVSPAPSDAKKLKSKAKTPRMTKSKSPSSSKVKNSGSSNNNNTASPSKLGKKKKKGSKKGGRRRATSDAQSVGVEYSRSNKSASPMPLKLDVANKSLGAPHTNNRNKLKQNKKTKKYESQTPASDYVGLIMINNNNDPFGVKKRNKIKNNKSNKGKKSSMTPKVSLSTTIESSVFSSDDELNGAENEDNNNKTRSKSQSARFSKKKKGNNNNNNNNDEKKNDLPLFGSVNSLNSNNSRKQQQKKKRMKLTNSMTINQGSKNLDFSLNVIKKNINGGFEEFHKAMNEQQNKLMDDLESIYDDKKEELIDIEHKLFENAQKSKNVKPKEYEFNPNINLIFNKPKILQQIKKYGYIEGVDTNNDENVSSLSLSMHLNGNSVIIHDDDYKGEQMDDDFDDFDEMDDGELSTAAKQKLVLGEIQQKTMSKLDTVILMEKEAKKKAKQAAILTNEVDEALKDIDGRTQIINEKLAAAKPELDKARAAVSGIEIKDINEIKTLKAPPVVIENVITATVMILGHKIKEWNDVKKLLSYKFKPELLNFDTYTLTKATRQKVYKKYAGKEDFNYDRVYEGSKCCGNLVLWVLSQINYSRVLDVIIPLEKEVKKLKKQSKKKQKLAKQLLKIVNELEENIKLYTNQCNQMIDHIIKSTDYELKQFSDKLQPLNQKFNAILKNKVLD